MRRLSTVIAIVALAAILFGAVVRQLSFVSLAFAANDDIRRILHQSISDQRDLARSNPQRESEYRARYESIRQLLMRMEVLELTRRTLIRRFEWTLVAVVSAMLLLAGALYLLEVRGREKRLVRIQTALERLSQGESDIQLGERGRDLVGRIATMIEATSRDVARARKRVQYLEHLSAWQEAARRHAHEIRTPLTAAQLEVTRLARIVESVDPQRGDEVRSAEASVLEELEQLRRFTASFVSFATVGSPQRQACDLGRFVADFCTTFAPTWPQLNFRVRQPAGVCQAEVDREMVRQVLVNLCTNSALAVGDAGGTLEVAVERHGSRVVVTVADDGPGVPERIRARIFEPYTTTRRIGEGMGLGLSISKKIMLDHDGDLELIAAERGATFRLIFPAMEEA
jgi:signal transduction histidine kinase